MKKLPVLFLSHGSPMLALETEKSDEYIQILRELGQKLPTPKAILSIGAHFYGPYKRIDVSENPQTIHDFWGFPEELYSLRYEVPGFPEWEKLIKELVPEIQYEPTVRGLDHGTWTVLMHLFPEARIPVFSISIDSRDSLIDQFELGKKLRILRDNGVFIIANGNIVHSLAHADFDQKKNEPLGFAQDFDEEFGKHLADKDYTALLNPYALKWARESVPTLEHYIPAIITLGASYPDKKRTDIYNGFELGSIGRRAFGFGI